MMKRQPSPRVKPGSHYARVVANILCNRPCGRPMSPPDVYANLIVKKYFPSPTLTETELQEYTDKMYGSRYMKTDVFTRMDPLSYRRLMKPTGIDPLNRNCMLPIYTEDYIAKVKDGSCCKKPENARRNTWGVGGWVSPKGTYHPLKVMADSSDEWEHDPVTGKRTKRIRSFYSRYPQQRQRHIDTDSDSDGWEHDHMGKRTKPKPNHSRRRRASRRSRHIDTDSDSDAWEHDQRGKRTKMKPHYQHSRRKSKGQGSRRRNRHIDTDSDSDGWEHDQWGKRTRPKHTQHSRRKSKGHGSGKPSRHIDTDSDSDEWEHDKWGRRTKLKPNSHRKPAPKRNRHIDTDSNSDSWEHDHRGKRTRPKPPQHSRRKSKGHGSERPKAARHIDSDSDSDGWEHDQRGKRTRPKRQSQLKRGGGGHSGRKARHIDTDSDSDNWQHDKQGNRTIMKAARGSKSSRKQFEYPKRKPRREKNASSDSDSDAWQHDQQGKRIKRKAGYKPRKGIGSDSDSEGWVHDARGKRTKRVKGYKSRKHIASDSDSDAWLHDKQGKRTKRVPGYKPRKGIHSDPDSDNWQHDNKGKRTRRKESKGKSGRRNKDRESRSARGRSKTRFPHLGGGDYRNGGDPDSARKKPRIGSQDDTDLPVIHYKATEKRKFKGGIPQKTIPLSKKPTKFLHGGVPRGDSIDQLMAGDFNFVPQTLPEEDEDSSASEGAVLEAGDPGINTCWELSEILFKSPYNKTIIPAPENILSYIEDLMPKVRLPRGVPVATRRYPNGALFCSTYENGSGLIFYPHGGLAVVITAPKPQSRILIIRDPLDGFFFMDKAIMAHLNSFGQGEILDENGAIRTQYNLLGGFHMEHGMDQPSQRWLWNKGGLRLIVKLNKYIRLHISKLDTISLVFNGNKRGVHLNVGAGRKVVLIRPPSAGKPKSRNPVHRPKKDEPENNNNNNNNNSTEAESTASLLEIGEYLEGKFSSPVLGFVDNEHEDNNEYTSNISHKSDNNQIKETFAL